MQKKYQAFRKQTCKRMPKYYSAKRKSGSGCKNIIKIRKKNWLKPAHSLVLDDISDITALLSGQSRQTGLAGNEAALWWRDLPLARMMLKQGRATLSFN